DTPEQVERSPRAVQAVELVASTTDSLVALDPGQRTPDSDREPDSERRGEDWSWVSEALHQVGDDDQERSTVNE
ncbi:MAG TPA: hypothetical protein VN327_06675, partial [Pseudonocardiaceae bacterium]|nr:hypothetical protein [Pseudonocardiaceae bacterium]